MANKIPETVGKPGLRDYALLHGSFLLYSLVAVASKTAALQGLFTLRFFLFAGLEVVILGVYALLWQQCLKQFSLIKAYANKGVVVLWNLIWAVALFSERVTVENILGSVIILVGIVVVSSDES